MNQTQMNNIEESPSGCSTNAEIGSIPPVKNRLSAKRILIAFCVIVAIAAITATLMIPQGAATLPLEVNYTVGEKMAYESTMAMSFQYDNSSVPTTNGPTSPNQILPNSSLAMTQTIEVIGFDGEYYTLNHTLSLNSGIKPVSLSLIEKMNKTGYSAYLLDLGTTQQELPASNGITSNSYLTQLLSKPEVKVGDTVKVPFPNIGNSNIGLTGDLTMTFKGLQDLKVPAGTYKVFRIDLSCNNLKMNYQSPLSNFTNIVQFDINMNADINYQIYIEYGTMRQIRSSIQETITMSSTIISGYTMTINVDMTLIEHIKPS